MGLSARQEEEAERLVDELRDARQKRIDEWFQKPGHTRRMAATRIDKRYEVKLIDSVAGDSVHVHFGHSVTSINDAIAQAITAALVDEQEDLKIDYVAEIQNFFDRAGNGVYYIALAPGVRSEFEVALIDTDDNSDVTRAGGLSLDGALHAFIGKLRAL